MFIRAYKRGLAARSLRPIYWERRWTRKLSEVRAELNIPPEPDRVLAVADLYTEPSQPKLRLVTEDSTTEAA